MSTTLPLPPTTAPGVAATRAGAPVGPDAAAGAGARTPPSVAPLSWRVIRDGDRSGADNMARDHALAQAVADGTGVLRLYGWSRPTVSFGRNEPARDAYSREIAEGLGVDFVRRPTGGRAVLHGREITYSVVASPDALGGPRAAYRTINAALATALRDLGAPVELAGEAPVSPVDAGPCFREPAQGEIVAAGRKLVGSAQARVQGALLQHGSIVLTSDQHLLELMTSRRATAGAPASLSELLGPVDTNRVLEAITSAFEVSFGGTWAEGELDASETDRARALQNERYGRDTWTWRR